jgi:hypothetical protein
MCVDGGLITDRLWLATWVVRGGVMIVVDERPGSRPELVSADTG